MTILYVDDDPDDRQVFVESLKSINDRLTCITARDGLEALTYLDTHNLPDVVFLDVNMPLMDGKTCLAEIRGNARTSGVPVIIFTTSSDPAERVECEVLGANDFVRKPVSYTDMKKILSTIFNSSKILDRLKSD